MPPLPRFIRWATFLALSCAVGRAGAADPPLASTLRKLEKEIAAVRGLEFKKPVVAEIIHRPKEANSSIQGYYDLKKKTLFLYDDIPNNYERGVLVHEMVHALQDQHFKLTQLHAASFGGEAELARAALIEGDASFTMIELLKKDQPRITGMLDMPLTKAKDLQRGFIYGQGARYVKALKDKGGWAAVNSAYRFPPSTTAAILHPEGVETIDLGPGSTRGELAIVQMFAKHPATASAALEAASGWKADCEVKTGDASRWTVAFTSRAAAARFQTTIMKLENARVPNLERLVEKPGENVWKDAKGGFHAVIARGEEVFVLTAPDAPTLRALRERAEGPPVLVIYAAREKGTLTFGTLIDRLLEADLVCIGEQHDSAPNHRVQLQILAALYARDPRLGVGMEMFQRPFQESIDRYFQGKSDEAEFLKATEYRQRWGFDWSLYRPLVDFCRKNEVPLAALNAPRELTRRISKVGHAGLTDAEKEQLGTIDFQVAEHRAYWFERLAKLHGNSKATPEEKERSYQVMTVWDEYMGDSAARFQQARRLRRLVVLAGSGHIERGFGIPARAVKRSGGKYATVRVEVGIDLDKVIADPAADFVVIVK